MRMSFHFCPGLHAGGRAVKQRRLGRGPNESEIVVSVLSTGPARCAVIGAAASSSTKTQDEMCQQLTVGFRFALPIAAPPLPRSRPEVTTMLFAVSAILIGVLGIFYVRRRSARKGQSI
jgi:hypothetical protein